MKTLKFKTTSKKVKFEAFVKLSSANLFQIKGGTEENPPEETRTERNE